jgi:uncharacterized membrane protein YhaH (DUF805 family)
MKLQEYWDTLEAWIRDERIGRRAYVHVNVINGLIGFAAIFTPFLILLFLPDFQSDFLTIPFSAIGICAAIVMIIVYIGSSIARLRDIGVSPNWFVLGLVPYVNIFFFLAMALKEGKVARNRATRGKKKERGAKPDEESAPETPAESAEPAPVEA